MSRSAETKTYGSIRKVKHYGACGVILGLAALGTALSSGTVVHADEVTTNATNAKQVQSAPTSNALESQESAKAKEGTIDVTVNRDKVEKAVSEAKAAGLNVVVDTPADGGTATSPSDLEKRQKEVEKNYDNQAEVVKKEADRFKEEVATRNKEIKTVKEENAKAKKDYEDAHAKYQTDLKTANDKNAQIDKDNQAKHGQYLAQVDAVKAENDRIKKENETAKSQFEKAVADQNKKNADIDKENAAAKKKYEEELGKWTERKHIAEADMATYLEKKKQYEKDLAAAKLRNEQIDKENATNLANYNKETDARNEYNARIRKENEDAQKAYEKALAELNVHNGNIDADNKVKQDEYDKSLRNYTKAKAKYDQEKADYDRKLAEYNKQTLQGQGGGVKIVGEFDESKRGSIDYYSKLTAVFDPSIKDLEVVDGGLGANKETRLTIDKGLIEDETHRSSTGFTHLPDRVRRTVLTNITKGSAFTLHNVGRTKSGKTISARLTVTSDAVPEFKIKGNAYTHSSLGIGWYMDGSQGERAVVGMDSYNYLNPDFDILI